jgi:hypothetical protein
MINIIKKILTSSIFYIIPFVVNAQDEFVPLSKNLPKAIDMQSYSHNSFIDLLNGLFGLSIIIAAILAVIMLAVGGFKYMTSDSVFKVGGAKEQMQNAIVGLIIVLVSVLILSVINPEIVSLKLFQIN